MSLERILAHSSEQENGCWLWHGAMDKVKTPFPSPMLRLSQPRRLVSARRYAYEVHNQVNVPSNFVVTAFCKNSICVNPAHLVAILRGKQGHRLIGDWKPEHCQHGHEFSEWNTGRTTSGKRYCIACDKNHAKEYAQQRRLEKPEYLKQLRLTRRSDKQHVVDALKSLVACKECGETRPACLDFHHIDPTTKLDTISALVNSQRTIEVIMEEAKKCIVLCANCHRNLHANERS